MGTLYVVATPIGNLSDISKRALEVLQEVDIILAEDTRVTSALLRTYKISKKMLRYDQHSFRNEEKKLEILNLLMQGNNMALVTDAGTPGISDPGNELIDYLLHFTDYELRVIPIPGASSVSTALSVCGFDVSSYLYVGFFPKKKHSQLLSQVKEFKIPLVFFESPYRIVKTLEDIKNELGGDTRVFIGREMTKMHEEYLRGTVEEIHEELSSRESIKGEIVVIVEL